MTKEVVGFVMVEDPNNNDTVMGTSVGTVVCVAICALAFPWFGNMSNTSTVGSVGGAWIGQFNGWCSLTWSR